MSPLSRNHVTQFPNARPPSPHSSRVWIVTGRRQRAATKPMTVTRAKIPAKMANCTWWSANRGTSGPPFRLEVHHGDDECGQSDKAELEPVEERQAEQPRLDPVVERGDQWQDDGHEQQPVPSAAPRRVRVARRPVLVGGAMCSGSVIGAMIHGVEQDLSPYRS